ncbi:MAG: CBS domain-containing protein [Pelagibacteraceae bacterium]|nr:CBS domain-containing protein [Pelagibacteraceae bacterium]PHX89561.1 MAG: histidine kinase [Pelagibacteraceae bacterium]
MFKIEDFLKLNKNRKIWTILKDQSVRQALILMSEKNIGAIIVVDNNNGHVGIFSERDYARKIILKGKNSKDTVLEEVMTEELITITKDYKIDQCMEIMTEKKIRHLPILEDKKIVGIISIGDVLKIMIEEQKELINHLQKFITS